MPSKRVSRYLLAFVGWSLLVFGLYHLGADVYARTLLVAADAVTDVFVPVTLGFHPNGVVILSPEASAPMGTPYRLYLIGLNVIFAPALVLTTFGLTTQGAVRSLLAIAIVMALQAIQVALIVLFTVTHPDNELFELGFSRASVAVIDWSYTFFDRMGYALLPFIAWALVSFDRLTWAMDAATAVTTKPATKQLARKRQRPKRLKKRATKLARKKQRPHKSSKR